MSHSSGIAVAVPAKAPYSDTQLAAVRATLGPPIHCHTIATHSNWDSKATLGYYCPAT